MIPVHFVDTTNTDLSLGWFAMPTVPAIGEGVTLPTLPDGRVGAVRWEQLDVPMLGWLAAAHGLLLWRSRWGPMSERAGYGRVREGHRFDVWQENRWPFQWIGQCLCGRGIRCNSRDDAYCFFDREGCREPDD